MSYIKHNVNMSLLFLLLFTATSFVGATVFFQQKFDNMVADYNSQIDEMNGLAQELSLKQSALADAEKDLELRQAREDKLNKINQKLASAVAEQPAAPTAAVVKEQGPRQVPQTFTGTGFSARPRRGSYAYLGI